MHLLERIDKWADIFPNQAVHINRDNILTYFELRQNSNALSVWLQGKSSNNDPIIVYGHKENEMLICFLASVKAGHAYIPVDISIPFDRLKDIIETSNAKIVIAVDELSAEQLLQINREVIIINGVNGINEIISAYKGKYLAIHNYVKEDEDFYVIFTSGSTGRPKGVRITLGCLLTFINWTTNQFQIKPNRIIMNQAPFSFDLSVMDLYLTLFTGGCLWSIDKNMILRPRELFDGFMANPINIWVSTPSFAEFCLADRTFSDQLLTNIEMFIFCGETLTNECAYKLSARFPKAQIYNTYGPTEATVAVTSVLVDTHVLEAYNPLPIGKPAAGIQVAISIGDKSFDYKTADYESLKGEIVIKGASVSPGYLNDLEKTVMNFYDENGEKCYKTGDEGYFKDGYLFYSGRIDNQIKLHGYRIELEDIENKLTSISIVRQAVVIPKKINGKYQYLQAVVVLNNTNDNSKETTINIKAQLSSLLPGYMVPQKIIFCDNIPMTANGKVNRNKILEVLM